MNEIMSKPCRGDQTGHYNPDWCLQHDQSVFACANQRRALHVEFEKHVNESLDGVFHLLDDKVKHAVIFLRAERDHYRDECEKLTKELDEDAALMEATTPVVDALTEKVEALQGANADMESIRTERDALDRAYDTLAAMHLKRVEELQTEINQQKALVSLGKVGIGNRDIMIEKLQARCEELERQLKNADGLYKTAVKINTSILEAMTKGKTILVTAQIDGKYDVEQLKRQLGLN